MSAAPLALDSTVSVETPELVLVSYSVAGLGSRAAAAFVDFLLSVAALLALDWVGSGARAVFGGRAHPGAAAAGWVAAFVLLAQFAVLWGYHVLFEVFWDGQTPGKRWLGLRVVRDGGYSVSLGAAALRNLVRVLDAQPFFFYGVGAVAATASKRGKRLGDLVAGTLVVHERLPGGRGAPAAARPRGAGPSAPPNGAPPAGLPRATLLDDERYAVLERFAARRRDLEPARAAALARQLTAAFAPALEALERERGRAPAPPSVDGRGGDATGPLGRLYARERAARAAGAAVAGARGGGRERYAIVAAGAGRWAGFAERLGRARRGGLAALGEDDVRAFAAEYRDAAADLARLTTALAGRESDDAFRLGRLVSEGHNLLYRRETNAPRAALRYVLATLPAEVRRAWRPIALAALLLFGPFVTSAVAVARRPALADEFVPAAMRARARGSRARAQARSGYIPDPEAERPVMAGEIITNNVLVTYLSFAAGVTAGVGTVLSLVVNGVMFGGVLGLYQSLGTLPLLLAFVAPHSVLELSAICVGGGAGFLLAAGVLLPGRRTRREAVAENGRRAVHLMVFATLELLIAGSIEGLVSPIPTWPLGAKVAVMGATAVFLAGWLSLGRGALRGRRAL